MDFTYVPYVDPALDEILERIHPPRVSIDNYTFEDCTLVKVDSVNKPGFLLEMVQVLTDIDLVISKSYINTDGSWIMDVFHVTDLLGNQVTDLRLKEYIREGICASRRAAKVVPPITKQQAKPGRLAARQTAIEITGLDKPGLMSEISCNVADLGCHVSSAVAWTYNNRVACIIYVDDSFTGNRITDPIRMAQVQAQLECVVEAHHISKNETWSVRLLGPAPGRTHTERRLHQLLTADRDYQASCSCCGGDNEDDELYGYATLSEVQRERCYGTHVRIGFCREKAYSVINIRCRDRPKLLFDTVCTLTDLDYIVHHAGISSKKSLAFQEYFVTHKNRHTVESEEEKRRVTQCLIAATERRVSYGTRLDFCTEDDIGLLSEITRIFRETGLTIARAEVDVHGKNAVGTFYLKDLSGDPASREDLEKVGPLIGGSVIDDPVASPGSSPSRTSNNGSSPQKKEKQRSGKFSLGRFLSAIMKS